MRRQCMAHTKRGTRCLAPSVQGFLRCRLHGAGGGRPPGIAAHPNTLAALNAGRERWLARMRLAKERGLIEKFPNGRRRRGSPKRSADKIVARAQRVMEAAMAKRSTLPAAVGEPTVAVKPWGEMSKGEKLAANTDLALDFTRQLLELPFDPENVKLLGHQKDAALTIISQQIRIEAERLRAPPTRGGSVEEFYRRYDGGSSTESERELP